MSDFQRAIPTVELPPKNRLGRGFGRRLLLLGTLVDVAGNSSINWLGRLRPIEQFILQSIDGRTSSLGPPRALASHHLLMDWNFVGGS